METLVNSNKTNVVFANNGGLFNSTPHPSPPPRIYVHTSAALGRVLTNYVALQHVEGGQPCSSGWYILIEIRIVDNIKTDLEDVEYEHVYWARELWRANVVAVMHLRVV
jgi:hypothetical protein